MIGRNITNTAEGIQDLPSRDWNIPKEILSEVSSLVDVLEGSLANLPYDRLIQEIIGRGGDIRNLNETGIVFNVIPSNQKIACSQITLALSTGISSAGPLYFPRVMRSVREYLIDCEHIAEIVVLLTDTWSPQHIKESIGDILAHARHNRYIVPHLVNGSRILRVDWPVNLA